MIGRLRGTLLERQPGSILLDVGGVGYEAAVSLHTFSSLPPVGSTASVEVVTVLRENALELFAFADLAEKQAFALLRTVSGIGPRMAIAVLSGIRVEELARAVADEDARRLTAIPGIGRKTAERMILDLRGKLEPAPSSKSAPSLAEDDAVEALVGLGYRRGEAEKAARAATAAGASGLEDVLRRALSGLVKAAGG